MAAQPTGLPLVPAGLPEQQTSALGKTRAHVEAEGKRLQHDVEAHHAKCAHVGLPIPLASGQTPDPNEAVLKEQCDVDQAKIDREVRQYAEDAKAYRAAVHDAIVSSPASKTMFAARVSLKGGVELLRGGTQQPLTSSTIIHLTSGDRLTTAAHARAAFTLPNKSQIILGPQSDVTLAKMVNDPSPAKRHIALMLTSGLLRWISTDTAQAATTLKLRAGSAQVGAGDVQASISASGDGYVALFKGTAQIVPEHNASALTLHPNEITTFTSSNSFAAARPMQPGEIRPL